MAKARTSRLDTTLNIAKAVQLTQRLAEQSLLGPGITCPRGPSTSGLGLSLASELEKLSRRLGSLPALLTVPEAADILRIGRSLAYQAVADGRLPSIRIGRRLLVPTLPLLRFLAGESETLADSPMPHEPEIGEEF